MASDSQRIVGSPKAGTAGLLIINTASFSVIRRAICSHRITAGTQSKRFGQSSREFNNSEQNLATVLITTCSRLWVDLRWYKSTN